MTPRERDRLYLKRGRFYADLRDYSDVGGGQEAMIPPGERYATRSRDVATSVLAARLDRLKAKRAGRVAGLVDDPRLSDYARAHLEAKRHAVRESTWTRKEIALRRFVERWDDPRLSDVTPELVADYIRQRAREPGLRGERVRPATIRKELGQLAHLFDQAVRQERAARNPVLAVDWPKVDPEEPEYFEPGDVARIIDAAFALASDPHRRMFPFAGELVATYALTGGRRSEVAGLRRRDVDLAHDVIHIVPNAYRRLKTRRSTRRVPLWPQLREILTPYLERTDGPADGLLFPGRKGMLTDLGYGFDLIADKAGIPGRLRPHGLRHTYAATRVQTVEGGFPVSMYTVARELGHANVALLERLYGHLQNDRVRAEVVEYREKRVISMRHKGMAG